jgi:hypothetical protein
VDAASFVVFIFVTTHSLVLFGRLAKGRLESSVIRLERWPMKLFRLITTFDTMF